MNDLTEFRPMTGMDMNSIASQGYGMVQYGPTDDKLIVGFYKKSVLNAARSREMGQPVYEGRDFVKIQHPGETLNIVDRPVNESDMHRWPRQWQHYQKGVNQIPDGVPINLLFPAKPEIETMLRGYNIHTVEQLAGLSAQGISTVGMGAQDWVNAAQRYMERANKGVDHHKFEKAIAEKDAQIALLTRQVAEVTALVRQQAQPRNVQAPVLPDVQDDYQTMQINATHQSTTDPFTPPPAQFHTDLSAQVQPTRRPGRPRKVQEH
jgi:hypothetical protein